MRCLILIVLSLALANASWYNKNRFDRLLRGYGQQSRRLGGLHDIIGQGYYPGQEEGQGCSPWNQDQCYQDEYDQDEDDQIGFGRTQWKQQCPSGDCEFGQNQWNQQCQPGDVECEIQMGQNPWGQQNQWQCQGGQCDQELFQNQDEDQYGQQGLFGNQDQDLYSNEYDTEFESGYGRQNQFQQLVGGQCSANPRYLPQLETINCQLATGLYKQAKREQDDKNIVVSPTAVLLALGALNVGAKSHTKKEIGITTQVGGTGKAIQGLSALHKLLKKGGQSQSWDNQESWLSNGQRGQGCVGGQCTQIKPITGIFLSQQTPCQQQFVQIVQGCLGVKVSKCNFQQNPQQCRQKINQWVSAKTQHKMPRLVPQDAITDNTKMLVVSGLQLKAKWGQQFKNHQTKRGIFHPLDSQKIKTVPVMQKRGVFKYHENEHVKVVGIPTQGNDLTMYVILPKCKKCLLEVEREQLLEGDQLKRLLDNCDQKRQQVDVKLPKFQIKHKIDAKRTLLNKGMINMCEQNTADFSGITGCAECSQKAQYNLRRPLGQRSQMGENDWSLKQGQIHLNKFLHQATIKVTDSGITSAGPQDNYQEEFYQQQEQQYGSYQNQIDEDDEDQMYDDQSYMTGRDRFDEITGMNRFGSVGKKQFNAKHPFAFVVRHNPTKQVLLFGRVIDAGQKQSTGGYQQMQEIMTADQF